MLGTRQLESVQPPTTQPAPGRNLQPFRGYCVRLLHCLMAIAVISGLPMAAMAQDCNSNGIDDACDLNCVTPGGLCNLPGCGQSFDCNTNSVPDECDLATIEVHDLVLDPPLPIPDSAADALLSVIFVPSSAPIRDVDVGLDITHPRDGDLGRAQQ